MLDSNLTIGTIGPSVLDTLEPGHTLKVGVKHYGHDPRRS
jgi:hypothetical protein